MLKPVPQPPNSHPNNELTTNQLRCARLAANKLEEHNRLVDIYPRVGSKLTGYHRQALNGLLAISNGESSKLLTEINEKMVTKLSASKSRSIDSWQELTVDILVTTFNHNPKEFCKHFKKDCNDSSQARDRNTLLVAFDALINIFPSEYAQSFFARIDFISQNTQQPSVTNKRVVNHNNARDLLPNSSVAK